MEPATVLGCSWAVLIAAAMWGHRPRPTRRLGSSERFGRVRIGPLTRAGRVLRGALGLPPDPDVDRALGAACVGVAILLPISPILALLPIAAGALLPRLTRRRSARAATDAWADAVPDTVDLFALALAGGLTVPLGLAVVGPRAPAPVGPELVAAERRFRHGEPLGDALNRVADSSPAIRPLLSVLVAAHCDGAPVVEPLARLADEQRATRRRIAEARARQVPVRMLFPLVCCTLPAFVLLTVFPPIISALGQLQG